MVVVQTWQGMGIAHFYINLIWVTDQQSSSELILRI